MPPDSFWSNSKLKVLLIKEDVEVAKRTSVKDMVKK